MSGVLFAVDAGIFSSSLRPVRLSGPPSLSSGYMWLFPSG